MELEKLLAPISQDLPCGPNLEIAPDFMALEQASKGKPERRMGEEVVLAIEPVWTDIKQRAEALFPLTKDLRVAILLLRANTRCEGMVGFAFSLNLIQEMLARYWDSVHPRLEPDDDNDPTRRLSVLSSLEDPETLVRDLSSVKFICANNHAQLSVRDILVALGKLSAAGSGDVPNQAEIESIIQAPENETSVQAMHDALQVLDSMQVLLSEKVGSERVLDFKPLSNILKAMLPLCKKTSESEEMQGNETHANQQNTPAPLTGDIRSREDVVRMLEKICNFIERTEPTNPAPLLIRRAQSLLAKNFIEIIEELGSEGLSQIKRMADPGGGKK